MKWSLQRGTPSIEPVTLTEAKQWLRVDDASDDTRITALITAARAHVESIIKRQLIQVASVLYLDSFFGADSINLPYPPLVDVQTVEYRDSAGTYQSWSSSEWVYSNTGAEPAFLGTAYSYTWPSGREAQWDDIAITYRHGYGSAATNVPGPIKQAILTLVGNLYAHRESIVTGIVVNEIEMVLRGLLSPYVQMYVEPWSWHRYARVS